MWALCIFRRPHTATNSLLSKLHLVCEYLQGEYYAYLVNLSIMTKPYSFHFLVRGSGPKKSRCNFSVGAPARYLVISALTLCCELLLHGPQVTVLTKPFASHIIPYQKKHSLRRALVPSIPWCLNDENSLFLSPSRLYPEDPSSSNLKRLRF